MIFNFCVIAVPISLVVVVIEEILDWTGGNYSQIRLRQFTTFPLRK